MKTLDEVIKALTICKNPDINRNCKDCPMPDTHECMGILMTDALHYLKEYQQTVKWVEINAEQFEQTREFIRKATANNPLTWDELKQMVGKPVWVEYNRHLSEKAQALSKGWFVIFDFRPLGETEMMLMTNKLVFTLYEQQSDLWQAYRKERS